MSDELMNEIKRAAVGDGKYAGLPSHVYSLFGDALAEMDELAALEAKLSKTEEERRLLDRSLSPKYIRGLIAEGRAAEALAGGNEGPPPHVGDKDPLGGRE